MTVKKTKKKIGLALLLASVSFAAPTSVRAMQVCPAEPQPLPPAIDSHGLPRMPNWADAFEFAAEPSLQAPGRAWVVRALRNRNGAMLTVLLLRQRHDCNVYDEERRWTGEISATDFEVFAAAAGPLIVPPPEAFAPPPPGGRDVRVAIDGTGIDARVYWGEWRTQMSINHYSQGGSELSALFRNLVARLVPQAEMPGDDWRIVHNR